MQSFVALSILSVVFRALAQDVSSSSNPSSVSDSAPPTGPLPTLLNDVKLGDVYEVTMQAPNGTQYLTTSAGSVAPAMETLYTGALTTDVVMGWGTKGEIHQEVLQAPNGTVYTTTVTRTGVEWFADTPSAMPTPSTSVA